MVETIHIRDQVHEDLNMTGIFNEYDDPGSITATHPKVSLIDREDKGDRKKLLDIRHSLFGSKKLSPRQSQLQIRSIPDMYHSQSIRAQAASLRSQGNDKVIQDANKRLSRIYSGQGNRRVPRLSIIDWGGNFFLEVLDETQVDVAPPKLFGPISDLDSISDNIEKIQQFDQLTRNNSKSGSVSGQEPDQEPENDQETKQKPDIETDENLSASEENFEQDPISLSFQLEIQEKIQEAIREITQPLEVVPVIVQKISYKFMKSADPSPPESTFSSSNTTSDSISDAGSYTTPDTISTFTPDTIPLYDIEQSNPQLNQTEQSNLQLNETTQVQTTESKPAILTGASSMSISSQTLSDNMHSVDTSQDSINEVIRPLESRSRVNGQIIFDKHHSSCLEFDDEFRTSTITNASEYQEVLPSYTQTTEEIRNITCAAPTLEIPTPSYIDSPSPPIERRDVLMNMKLMISKYLKKNNIKQDKADRSQLNKIMKSGNQWKDILTSPSLPNLVSFSSESKTLIPQPELVINPSPISLTKLLHESESMNFVCTTKSYHDLPASHNNSQFPTHHDQPSLHSTRRSSQKSTPLNWIPDLTKSSSHHPPTVQSSFPTSPTIPAEPDHDSSSSPSSTRSSLYLTPPTRPLPSPPLTTSISHPVSPPIDPLPHPTLKDLRSPRRLSTILLRKLRIQS